MPHSDLRQSLRFYFVTDDSSPGFPAVEQVKAALAGGATMVQYRNKRFAPDDYAEVTEIRRICRANGVPFIVNDHLMLAKAVGADGVHVGQADDAPALARGVMGPHAIVGVSASTPAELGATDLIVCDYLGSGPVFATGTKTDAKPVRGIAGLAEIVSLSPLPVVGIGGIDAATAPDCIAAGAAGVAVISAISRVNDPLASARAMGQACGCRLRESLMTPWGDEFELIGQMLSAAGPAVDAKALIDSAGDDACRIRGIAVPVVSTDTQREGVHFQRSWQSLEAIGEKAVEVTLSDLAAAYARPVAVFVNLGMPEDLPASTAEALYRGIGRRLDRHGAGLGGGNVSRAEVLTLDLFAVGEGRKALFPTRAAARPGDILYVTGPLGLARCGLLALEKGDFSWPMLIERFRNPRARFDASAVLAAHGVRCVMDVSDGLAGDAAHIARAAGISIELEPTDVARDSELVRFCGAYGLDPAETVLRGGEDYELLFACSESLFDKIRTELPGACRVGRCLPDAGAPLIGLPDGVSSFQHARR